MANETESVAITPPSSGGLTERQAFAAAALSALIAVRDPRLGSATPVEDTLVTAKKAWGYADALIRTEGPTPVPPPA